MMMAYLTSLCLLALTLAPTQALVVTLTSSNFDQVHIKTVLKAYGSEAAHRIHFLIIYFFLQYVNGDKFAFVEFYAPCKSQNYFSYTA